MTKGKDVDRVISGYLDVKVPVRCRRRPFGLWRCWRRYWVEARRGGELVLSASPDAPPSAASLVLPPGATLCRTASRSRQFAFGAMHDGRPAGAGQEVFLYLAAKSEADTERWMAALRGLVSQDDRAAAELLRGRRLSRSESDLLGPAASTEASPSLPLRGALRLLHGRRRADTLRDTLALASSPPSPLALLGGKIASGLISAGLGLMLSTPGGSEVEDNDEDEDGASGDRKEQAQTQALDRRRESGVSVASGIYEEISDCNSRNKGEDCLYENTPYRIPCCESAQYEDPALLRSPPDEEIDFSPPPLPPRCNLTPISKLLMRPSECEDYVRMERSDCDEIDLIKGTSRCRIRSLLSPMRSLEPQDNEPAYMPMSPLRNVHPTPEPETAVNIAFQNTLRE